MEDNMCAKLAALAVLVALAASSASPQRENQVLCLRKFVAPVYSPIARQARIQGAVRVDVTVDPDGVPGNVTAMEGHPILREYAVEAIKQWRFCFQAKSPRKISLILKFELEGTTSDWAPTYVAFDPSGEIEIMTAAVKPTMQR